MSKSRGYVFTLNNWTEEEERKLKEVDCQYLVYGYEQGEEGTPHLQGYIYFKNPRAFGGVKKVLGSRYHIERQQGTCEQAIAYCKKDGYFKEVGDRPIGGVGKKCTMHERAERNKRLRDAPLNELVENGEIHITEVRKLKNARLDLAQEGNALQTEDVRGIWYWGAPGVGKSHRARTEYPNAYIKAQNKWWDGYQGQEAVILDDLDTDVLGHYLKIWADKWACTGEVKGGQVNLRHRVFVVTSNYDVDELFKEDQMRDAIFRRFKIIKITG